MTEYATVVTASAATGRRHRVDRWFYISVALVAILFCLLGFGPSLIDQSRRNAPLTSLAIAHAAVSSAWLLLFLTQATLAATRRIAVHRRMGPVAIVLAVAMIVLGFVVSVEEFRRGYDLSGDLARVFPPTPFEPVVLLVPLIGFANFGVLAAAGLWYRRRADIHKRLMLLAVVPLAAEPFPHLVGHLIGSWPAAQGIAGTIPAGGILAIPLMSVSAIYDRVSTGRIHPVSLWVPTLLFVWQIALMVVVFPSVAWRDVSTWLVR